MVLGWAVVVLMIYGLFFYNPAAKNDRPYPGRESLERLYSEQYGESPHFDRWNHRRWDHLSMHGPCCQT